MELDNDQQLAIVQNVISADNNYRLQYINIKPLAHANKRRWKYLVIGLFWLFLFLLTGCVFYWCAQHSTSSRLGVWATPSDCLLFILLIAELISSVAYISDSGVESSEHFIEDNCKVLKDETFNKAIKEAYSLGTSESIRFNLVKRLRFCYLVGDKEKALKIIEQDTNLIEMANILIELEKENKIHVKDLDHGEKFFDRFRNVCQKANSMLDQQIIQPRTAEIARNAINSNDSDALKLLPQDLRYQHADKILENLL